MAYKGVRRHCLSQQGDCVHPQQANVTTESGKAYPAHLPLLNELQQHDRDHLGWSEPQYRPKPLTITTQHVTHAQHAQHVLVQALPKDTWHIASLLPTCHSSMSSSSMAGSTLAGRRQSMQGSTAVAPSAGSNSAKGAKVDMSTMPGSRPREVRIISTCRGGKGMLGLTQQPCGVEVTRA